MKNKTCFFTGFMLLLLVVSLDAQQYVTLEDKQFRLNGQDYYPMICNYTIEPIYDRDSNKYFVAPFHSYNTTFFQEGRCEDSCAAYIQRDFNYIAGMGFNGVRFYSFYPKFRTQDSTFLFYFGSYLTNYRDSIFLNPSNPTDTNMQIVFSMYDRLLELANNTVNVNTNLSSPLKTIFIITGNRSDYSDYEIGIWNEYLEALSKHISIASNNEAILAYDLINEPCYTVEPMKSKTDACDMISLWCETIKTNDKKHLVTIGSCGFGDVFSFDPSLLKVDFLSLHYYPSWRPAYEDRHFDSIQERMRDRSVNNLFWMKNNCPRPWIVGETGFSASLDFTIDTGNMDGTLENQAIFAQHSLNAVANCGASGYSWGGYQDLENDTLGSPNFQSNFIGLIERRCSPDSLSEKPATDTIRRWTFLQDTCPICYSENYDSSLLYYNPYRHPTFDSTSNGYIKNGFLLNQNNDPIFDAYIGGHTWLRRKDTINHSYFDVVDYHYTFSDKNGYFKLIPFDYLGIINDSAFIYRIEIAASGSEPKFFVYWEPLTWPSNNSNILMNKNDYHYQKIVSNIVIPSGDSQTFEGNYKLTAENIIIQNNAAAFFYADYQVYLKPEFTSYIGSETRIYCSDTAFICNDYSWNDVLKKSSTLLSNQIYESEIQIKFMVNSLDENIMIFPNPSTGIINIFGLNSKEIQTYYVLIRDIFGSQVYFESVFTNEIILDLTSYQKGIYFITISTEKEFIVKKIIIE